MPCHLQPGWALISVVPTGLESPELPGSVKAAHWEAPGHTKQLGAPGVGRLAEAWHQGNVYLVIKPRNSSSDISLGEMSSAFASK